MSAISIANKDWSILDDVKSALSGATVGGSAVFAAVTAGTSDAQAEECQFTAGPAAIVRYLGTTEHRTPGGHLACALFLEVIVAAKVAAGGADESARLAEVLRLANAAKNAVGADKPADACAWGDDDAAVRQIEFGSPKIDAAHAAPWAVGRLPLTIGYVLDSDTSH
jgi:hypothetical protein